ncbi:hypothetical protein ACWYXK_13925 [Janthinobacterium lividum]
MSELADGLIDSIKLRLNNSFAFSFSLAWVVLNYKFFMVVFGGGNYSNKFDFIKNDLYQGDEKWQKGFLHPLYFALAYILIFPFLKILLAAIGELFDSMERWVIYKIKRVSVVSQKDKEEYFDAMSISLQGVKEELGKSRMASAKKENQLREEKLSADRRFQSAALRYFGFAMNEGGTVKEALDIFRVLSAVVNSGPIQPDFFQPEAIKTFVDNVRFGYLKKLARGLVSVSFDHESRINTFSRADVKEMSGIDEDNLDDFILLVLALGVIVDVNHGGGSYCTRHYSEQIEVPTKLAQIESFRENI